jgi:hypothetical protein
MGYDGNRSWTERRSERMWNLRNLLACHQRIIIGNEYDLHHTHIRNTKTNRRRFKLLLDSAWNCTLVEHEMSHPNYVPITETWNGRKREEGRPIMTGQWSPVECDKRERFLERHPRIAAVLTGEHAMWQS